MTSTGRRLTKSTSWFSSLTRRASRLSTSASKKRSLDHQSEADRMLPSNNRPRLNKYVSARAQSLDSGCAVWWTTLELIIMLIGAWEAKYHRRLWEATRVLIGLFACCSVINCANLSLGYKLAHDPCWQDLAASRHPNLPFAFIREAANNIQSQNWPLVNKSSAER